MNTRKYDADEIEAFIDGLAADLGIRDDRRYWPKWLFHTSDVGNLVPILESGGLLSRATAVQQDLLHRDIASSEMIRSTAESILGRVRLYFRPRTPTHFHTEGFRPVGQQSPYNVHCPVPVMLIFEAKSLLTREGTLFTNGNAASHGYEIGDSATFLRKIPFAKVYHDDAFTDAQRAEIVFHRNAEVLVSEPLPLKDNLTHVICRSWAEAETVRSWISSSSSPNRDWFKSLVRANTQRGKGLKMFFKRWTFVDTVSISDGLVTMTFNRDSQSPGPFAMKIAVIDPGSGKERSTFTNADWTGREPLHLQLPSMGTDDTFMLKMMLDGRLAYQNTFPVHDSAIIVPR